jgi:hypothetical protein
MLLYEAEYFMYFDLTISHTYRSCELTDTVSAARTNVSGGTPNACMFTQTYAMRFILMNMIYAHQSWSPPESLISISMKWQRNLRNNNLKLKWQWVQSSPYESTKHFWAETQAHNKLLTPYCHLQPTPLLVSHYSVGTFKLSGLQRKNPTSIHEKLTVEALKMRAPSICSFTPYDLASSPTLSVYSAVMHLPPHLHRDSTFSTRWTLIH